MIQMEEDSGPPPMDSEDIQGDVVQVVSGGLELMSAADGVLIDKQIATAKHYPRDLVTFREEAMMLATIDEETAASCFYAIPRAGKWIEGESVRLAEIVAHSYGNLRWDGDIVGEDANFVTASSICFDLQKNVAVRVRVRKVITGRSGRYNADMIGVLGAAAVKTGLRNSLFTVVPKSLVKSIYVAAREASLGKNISLGDLLATLVGWFAKQGVQERDICRILQVSALKPGGQNGITKDHVIQLRGLASAIKEGEITAETAFGLSPRASAPVSEADAELKGAAAGRRAEPVAERQPGEDDNGPPAGEAPADPTGQQESLVPPTGRPETLVGIAEMESTLVLKDGILRKARRENAGAEDLDNCDNHALSEYWVHLRGEIQKKHSRKRS